MRRGFAVRILAACIDLSLGMVAALLLSSTAGRWFAGRAVTMLSIGSPDSLWRGPLPMALGILGDFFYGLPFALLLVLTAELLFSAGPGKWALKMSVAAPGLNYAPFGRRLLRWTIKCVGLWGLVLALLLESGLAAVISLIAAGIVIAGFLFAVGQGGRALHDRLSGTAVISVPGRSQ